MDKVKFHDKEVPTLGDMQDLHNNVETWTEFLNSKFVTDRDIVCMGMDVEESSPASMSVAIKVDTTKGYGLAMTDDGETIYLSGNDTVAIAAADPGSARIDTVSIKLDHDDADNAYRWFRTTGSGLSSSLVATREDHGYALTVAEGTPGSGVAPATPAGYMKLAEVTVGAGVTSILNANIDDADSSDSWTTEADATIRETKLGKFRMFEQNGFYLLQYDGSTVISFDTTGDIVIGGNLTVEGTFTKLQTETVEIYDNILLLNSNVTGAASQDGGIQIQRGSTGADASLIWNETSDVWSCGLAGSEVEIVTLSGSQVLTNKTLTTPTIGSFTNATHDHADAAGGGTIGYSDLTGTPTSSSWTHNSLTGLDDGDYKHFTATNYTDLTDSGDTTLHYHAADRALASATGDLAYLRVASITATSGAGSTSTLSRADHAHTGSDGSPALSLSGFSSRVQAWQDASQAIATSTVTTVIFEEEIFDGDSEYNVSTGEFSPDTTGYYMITATIQFQNPLAFMLYIDVGGTDIVMYNKHSVDPSGTISGICYITSSQAMKIKVWHNEAGSETLLGVNRSQCVLSIHRLS